MVYKQAWNIKNYRYVWDVSRHEASSFLWGTFFSMCLLEWTWGGAIFFYSTSTQWVLVAWCSEVSVMALFDAMSTSIVRSDDYIRSLPQRWINGSTCVMTSVVCAWCACRGPRPVMCSRIAIWWLGDAPDALLVGRCLCFESTRLSWHDRPTLLSF
jgi:hypothetical protein